MENRQEKKAAMLLKAHLACFDVFFKIADEFFNHSFYDEAQEFKIKADKELDKIDQQNKEVLERKSKIKDLEGAIFMKKQQHEEAQSNAPEMDSMEVDDAPPAKKVKTEPIPCKIPGKKPPTQTSNKERKFACTWEGCGKSFVHKHHLDRHIKSVHQKIRIPCERGCGQDFADSDGMRTHIRAVHDKEKFSCPKCEKEYTWKADLEVHIARDHEGKALTRYPCEHCGKDFPRYRNLRNHISTVHAGERRHKCVICGGLFAQTSGLKEHMRTVHDKTEKFECSTCKTKFIYRSTLVKHIKSRSCRVCLAEYQCSTEFIQHRNSHSMTCKRCKRTDCKFTETNAHAKNTHIRAYDCPIKRCQGKFTAKCHVTKHLVGAHGMSKCLACPECFDNEDLMMKHCRRTHPQFQCALCTGAISFKYFTNKELSSHIINTHKDIFHCRTCGNIFATADHMRIHQCSGHFSQSELQLANFLRQPFNIADFIQTQSQFTDEDGKITQQLPIFPPQCYLFFNSSLNKADSNHDQPQLFLNQDQRLFPCGSTAILCWCLELNALAWCYEVIEWQRTKEGAILQKPHFDRTGMHFKRDKNDIIFNIRSTTLDPPYHMGHSRAAGNCWTELDFRATFSNMNYWPMHERLNSVHWRLLEDHIRKLAKGFAKVHVVTSAIFLQHGKIVSNYVKGVYVPPAFFKLAAFETFENKIVLHCWIMNNTEADQTVESS